MIAKTIVALVAALGGLVVTAPAASATELDNRPCVAKVEYQAAPQMAGWSRARVEERWEVTGMGRYVDVSSLGPMWIYPRCGYSFPGEAWYGAAFDGGLWMIAAWMADGATLQGNPRTTSRVVG